MSFYKSILCLLIGLTLSGCTTFKNGAYVSALDTDKALKQFSEKPKKIYLDYRFAWSPVPSKGDDAITEKERAEFIQVLNETGRFTIVTTSSEADETWSVRHIFHDLNRPIWGMISTLTLYILPYWNTESFYETELKVTNPQSNSVLFQTLTEEHFTSVNQILMIVAMPFNFSAPSKIRESGYRGVINNYLHRNIL